MEVRNLFTEDTDFNIVKSWLCDSTDGQTFSISEHFDKKIRCPVGMDANEHWNLTEDFFNSDPWESTLGYEHEYKVDDPEIDKITEEKVKALNALIDRLNKDPDYLNWDIPEGKKESVKKPKFEKKWAVLEIHHDSDKGPTDFDFEHKITVFTQLGDANVFLAERRNQLRRSKLAKTNEIVIDEDTDTGFLLVFASDDWYELKIKCVEVY